MDLGPLQSGVIISVIMRLCIQSSRNAIVALNFVFMSYWLELHVLLGIFNVIQSISEILDFQYVLQYISNADHWICRNLRIQQLAIMLYFFSDRTLQAL